MRESERESACVHCESGLPGWWLARGLAGCLDGLRGSMFFTNQYILILSFHSWIAIGKADAAAKECALDESATKTIVALMQGL